MSDSHAETSLRCMPVQPGPVPTFTLEQISQRYGVCTRTLRNYIKQGRLRATRMGRRYQVTDQALRDFFGENAA